MTPEEITAWVRGWSESGGPDRLGMEMRFDEGVGDDKNLGLQKDNLGDLDWDKIISKKGESRFDHIIRHVEPDSSRNTHGVFYGDPKTMIEQAWRKRGNVVPIDDGMEEEYIIFHSKVLDMKAD